MMCEVLQIGVGLIRVLFIELCCKVLIKYRSYFVNNNPNNVCIFVLHDVDLLIIYREQYFP